MIFLFLAALDLGQGVRMELVRVEAGKFLQGSPANEAGREVDEVQREVEITKPFFIGKAPVRRVEFERFVQDSGYKTEAEKGASGGYGVENGKLVQKKEYTWRTPGFAQTEQDPVVLVTYGDAQAFTKWLSGKTQRNVRLPSEAEWELAARRHGSLTDMVGRINQWCADAYAPWTVDDAIDPIANDGERRVLRGGSSLHDKRRARFSARMQQSPGSRNADNGFRVVVDDEVAPLEAVQAPNEPYKVAIGLAIMGVMKALIGLAFYFVFRTIRRALSNKPRVQASKDGMFIINAKPGSTVRVRYRRKNGEKTTRVVPVESRKQFLYTGHKPYGPEILGEGPGGFSDSDDGPDDGDDSGDNSPTTAAVVASSTWDSPRAY